MDDGLLLEWKKGMGRGGKRGISADSFSIGPNQGSSVVERHYLVYSSLSATKLVRLSPYRVCIALDCKWTSFSLCWLSAADSKDEIGNVPDVSLHGQEEREREIRKGWGRSDSHMFWSRVGERNELGQYLARIFRMLLLLCHKDGGKGSLELIEIVVG